MTQAAPTTDRSPSLERPYVFQRPSVLFFVAVTGISAALDLISKEWAIRNLAGAGASGTQRVVDVIPGMVDFVFAQNPGGAWSMLRNLPEQARRPFFIAVSTVASVFIASVYTRIDRRQWAMRWGLPFALGGAIGNLVDRMRHGWVVDFIHCWIVRGGKELHWPTFNVADVWIVAGVLLMALDLVTSRKLHRAREAASAASVEERREAFADPRDPS